MFPGFGVWLCYFTLNTARSSQLSALGHFTTTICMASTSHFLVYAIVCRLPKNRHPSARVKTTRPLPPVQESTAEGFVNSLLTPRG